MSDYADCLALVHHWSCVGLDFFFGRSIVCMGLGCV